MQFANLDMIVKNKLLQDGKPIHWYIEYLVHATACLRELAQDSLRVVNTVRLPINDYKAADIPEDYSDYVTVGIGVGQFIKPIPQMDTINNLRVRDSTGAYTTYANLGQTSEAGATFYGFSPGWNWMWNINEFGETQGRFFGGGGGDTTNGFKIIPERRQIQFSETIQVDEFVLIYVSDGQSADNFTKVDSRAFNAIAAYIDWKASPNRNNHYSPEGKLYTNKKRLLRAATDSFTIPDIKNTFWKAYKATLKN
jgi:hypothetical protein